MTRLVNSSRILYFLILLSTIPIEGTADASRTSTPREWKKKFCGQIAAGDLAGLQMAVRKVGVLDHLKCGKWKADARSGFGSPIVYAFNSYQRQPIPQFDQVLKFLLELPLNRDLDNLNRLNRSFLDYVQNLDGDLFLKKKLLHLYLAQIAKQQNKPIAELKINLIPYPILANIDMLIDFKRGRSTDGFDNVPSEIARNIYISSIDEARKIYLLEAIGIKHVLDLSSFGLTQSLTGQKDFSSYVDKYKSKFRYKHIPVDDTPNTPLSNYFAEAHEFIFQALEKNEKILIHCFAGISRSATIVHSLLVSRQYENQMSLSEAYELMQSKRSIIYPNIGFQHQLKIFAETQVEGYQPPSKVKPSADIPSRFKIGRMVESLLASFNENQLTGEQVESLLAEFNYNLNETRKALQLRIDLARRYKVESNSSDVSVSQDKQEPISPSPETRDENDFT